MPLQSNFNELHIQLSVQSRYLLALCIFSIAFVLRYLLWPVTAGPTFLTFYPAAFLVFYICGSKPGYLVIGLSVIAALTVFSPPLLSWQSAIGPLSAAGFFLLMASMMGAVVSMGQHWYQQLILKEVQEANRRVDAVNAQLHEKNELLVMAERSIGAGAWRWDINTDTMEWSNQLYALFGLDPALYPPTFDTWHKVVYPPDLDLAERTIREGRVHLKPFLTAYRILLNSGELRWIDSYGGPIYDKAGHPVEFSGICVNSTLAHQAQEQLRENEQRFHSMFTNLTVGYQSLDKLGHWLDANQKMADMLGYKNPQAMLGLSFISHICADIDDKDAYYTEQFNTVNHTEDELMLRRCDGETITVLISGRIQRDKRQSFIRSHYVLVDISERRRMELQIIKLNAELEDKVAQRTAELSKAVEDLQHLSRYDTLTGLPNRLSANERLHTEFLSMHRTGQAYAVLMLDIDFFKHINDTYGHTVGDKVLHQFAVTLRSSVRESDFAARYGGEEFIVILPNTALDDAYAVADKIRHAIETSFFQIQDTITVSIGFAMADLEQIDEYVAVKEADDWLYAAKSAGRNRIMTAGSQL
ncbi:MAG TPA: diguanylate cyclase [Methylophilus sp.]